MAVLLVLLPVSDTKASLTKRWLLFNSLRSAQHHKCRYTSANKS
jgi:hypothetical protein